MGAGCRADAMILLPSSERASKPMTDAHRTPVQGGVFFHGQSAECRALVQQAQAVSFAGSVGQPDIERTNQSLPNFLAGGGQNRAHPRPRQWPWLAGGGFASCPLLQRCSPKFLPLGYAHSSRDKKPRSAPSSTALRPCGCSSASPCLKPAIEAANERGVRPT